MARKPADTAGAARAGADTAPLPEGVTEDTLVVKGEAATAAPEAAPEPGTISRLPEGVTEETVVVGGEAADPMPEVGTADAPSTAPPLPGDATDDAPITGTVLLVTCSVAAGRRRAGRRWPAGTTRVAASALSAEDLEALRGDVMLRVELEAA